MQPYSTEETRWAARLAARLRLLQASSADDVPAVRQQHLAEEIEQALQGIPQPQRKSCLSALAEQFPAWQAQPSAAAAAAPSAPVAVEESPETRLQKLLEVIPHLAASQKREFAERLRQAGWGIKEGKAAEVALPEPLAKKLGCTPGMPIDVERAGKLFLILVDLIVSLEQSLWTTWRQIAPKSSVRRDVGTAGDFRLAAGRYLSGDATISAQDITRSVELRRALIAGLLAAIGGAPRDFAKTYLERLSPDVIREAAEMQKRGWKSLEVVCWEKFKELANEYGSEVAVENGIRDAIAKFAEEVIRGRAAESEG